MCIVSMETAWKGNVYIMNALLNYIPRIVLSVAKYVEPTVDVILTILRLCI